MPCRVWTDGEGELERQNAVSKYKTSLWKASANPGNRLGILTVDVKKKVGCGEGKGTVEHPSKSDKKDAHAVKKIVVEMFQRFPPK